jgi:predicted Zn finger-like uncharacterized protein
MPEQICCPECNATLRVPDSLLGKAVKCPKCQTTFTAELEEPEERERVVREPAPSSARRQRPALRQEEDEEEEELPEEEEEEERPRRRKRRRGRRSAAADAVAAPAICLIVLGGLDILLCIVNVILRLAGVGMAAAGGPMGPGKGGGNTEMVANLVGGIVGSIIGLCFAAVITLGGVKMKQLQSYGLVMTAAIFALLPCGNCCCIGLPLGIWALVVLNRPEVKDAFS